MRPGSRRVLVRLRNKTHSATRWLILLLAAADVALAAVLGLLVLR
jgi:type III secretory pathway component EscS